MAAPDAWKRRSVLSMDGGGIRGYATLRILQAVMIAIEQEEQRQPDPHESSFCPRLATIVQQNSQESTQQRNDEGNEPQSNNTPAQNADPPAQIGVLSVRTDHTTQTIDGPPPKPQEGYLPCHYFDLIAGTSTGGLNAIMLGRLRMSVDECLQEYPRIAESAFGTRNSLIRRIRHGAKYDAAPLVQEIERLVAERSHPKPPREPGNYAYENYPSPLDLCGTAVVSSVDDGVVPVPFLFRTYPNPTAEVTNPGAAQNYPISIVASATSAADLKFEPVNIDGKLYYDGGLGDNNPSPRILGEVMATLGPHNPLSNVVNIFVSIGTGVKLAKREKVTQGLTSIIRKQVGLINVISNAVGKLKRHALQVEKQHNDMLLIMKAANCRRLPGDPERYETYARFDGGNKIGILELDQWFVKKKRILEGMTTKDFIDHHMDTYLLQTDVQAEVQRCAKSLVAQRRAKLAADEDKWRRFAHSTLQACPLRGCPKKLHSTRAAVIQHIQHFHSASADQQYLIDNIVEYAPRLDRGPF